MTNETALQNLSKLKLTNDGNYSLIPQKYVGKRYVVYRVKLPKIYIGEKTRDMILKALDNEIKYIQLDDLTIMLNTITSIEPRL